MAFYDADMVLTDPNSLSLGCENTLLFHKADVDGDLRQIRAPHFR